MLHSQCGKSTEHLPDLSFIHQYKKRNVFSSQVQKNSPWAVRLVPCKSDLCIWTYVLTEKCQLGFAARWNNAILIQYRYLNRPAYHRSRLPVSFYRKCKNQHYTTVFISPHPSKVSHIRSFWTAASREWKVNLQSSPNTSHRKV